MNLRSRILHPLAVAVWLGMTVASHAQYTLDWADVGGGGGVREIGAYRMKGGIVPSAALSADNGGYQARFHFWSALDEEGQSSNPSADLKVSVAGSPFQLSEGSSLTIPITVSNLGPDTATSVALTFMIPSGLLLQFVTNHQGTTTVQVSNVTCSIASVPPHTGFDVQAVFSVDSQFFDINADIFDEIEDFTANHQTWVSAAEPDPNPANNQTPAVVAGLLNLDFGDARTPYPVTRSENGARHRNSSVYHFGALFDREPDGIHSALADCDDLGATADEDGIVLPPSFPSGSAVTVMVTVPVAGKLDAFFDWNNDNDWADAGERVTPSGGLAIGPGVIPVTVTVPTSATPTLASQPQARFRFSDVGGLADTGFHFVGEVQDYTFMIAGGIHPTVVLNSPPAGSTYTVGSSITLSANATASSPKTIASVTFLDNGNPLGTLTATPYSLNVSSLGVGSHVLTASAVDSAGLTGSSPSVTIAVVPPCPGDVLTWKGGSGNWSTASNWESSPGVPATSPPTEDDTAIINSGTVTVDTDVTVCRLNLAGGTIVGDKTLTVGSIMNWTGGRMDDVSGTGVTVIDTGGRLNLVNVGVVAISKRKLENGGQVVWTGTADLKCDSGAVLTNRAGATWEVLNNQAFLYDGGDPCRFDNAGIFRKTTGTGTTTFGASVAFNNYNLVDVQAGTLLCSDSFNHMGTASVASGAVLRMAAGSASGSFGNSIGGRVEWTGGTYQLNGGVQLNGPGLYANNGTLTVNTVVGLGNFDLMGTLNGSGMFTVTGTMNWTGGRMDDVSGTGVTVIDTGGRLNLVNVGTVAISKRKLENGGQVVWTGTADLKCDSGAVLTNRAGATWEVLNNQAFLYDGGDPCRFDNAGIFRKTTGTGTTTFGASVAFNSYNFVHCQTGLLRIAGGGSASGSFTSQAGARVEWSGTTFQLDDAALLDGAGIYTNAGTLTINGEVRMRNLDSTGTINGGGMFTVTGTMNWTGGRMDDVSGTGVTVIDTGGRLNLVNVGVVAISKRKLENGGQVVWTGTADLKCDSGAVLTNRAGATWEVLNNQAFLYDGGDPCRFDNAGIFRKTTGTGTTTFGASVAFNNWGSNHVVGGKLQLSATYTQYAGETSLCDGNIINFSPLDLLGGTLKGKGSFDPAVSGTVNNVGGTVSPSCSPGRLEIGGHYTQSPQGTLEIEVGGTTPGSSYDQLAVNGTATLGGKLVTKFINGFYPPADAVFSCVAAASRSGGFSSFSYPSNDVGMELIYVGTNTTIHVINVRPNLPVIPSQTIDEMAPFSLAVNASDDDMPSQTLTYALSNAPAGATITSSGVIQWTPTEVQGPMTTNITVLVTDNGSPNLSVSRTFQVTVREVNVAPQLAPLNDFMVNPGQTLNFTASATDADSPSNTLAFSLVNPPAGASIDANSGTFAWRALVSLAGTTNPVLVRVTDNGAPPLSDTRPIFVVVGPLLPVLLTPLTLSNGGYELSVNGPVGPDYVFQRSADFTNWTNFLTNTPVALPISVSDPNAPAERQFYRALLGP